MKTLNANPSLFYDLRALVEKVANTHYSTDAVGFIATEKQPGKITGYPVGLSELCAEARAILEKFKKLEER